MPQGVHTSGNLRMVTKPFNQRLSKTVVITFSGLFKEKILGSMVIVFISQIIKYSVWDNSRVRSLARL